MVMTCRDIVSLRSAGLDRSKQYNGMYGNDRLGEDRGSPRRGGSRQRSSVFGV
jgi:hypothetical protein